VERLRTIVVDLAHVEVLGEGQVDRIRRGFDHRHGMPRDRLQLRRREPVAEFVQVERPDLLNGAVGGL
jgi:hypothetical protein